MGMVMVGADDLLDALADGRADAAVAVDDAGDGGAGDAGEASDLLEVHPDLPCNRGALTSETSRIEGRCDVLCSVNHNDARASSSAGRRLHWMDVSRLKELVMRHGAT